MPHDIDAHKPANRPAWLPLPIPNNLVEQYAERAQRRILEELDRRMGEMLRVQPFTLTILPSGEFQCQLDTNYSSTIGKTVLRVNSSTGG